MLAPHSPQLISKGCEGLPYNIDLSTLDIFFISIYYGLFSIMMYSVIILKFIIKLSHMFVVFFYKNFHLNLIFFFVLAFHHRNIHFNIPCTQILYPTALSLVSRPLM